MDPHSETRLQLVHPVLADNVRQMATTLLQEGIEIRVVQGLRTYDEQAARDLMAKNDLKSVWAMAGLAVS